jgi:hypothetical protein
MYIIHAQYKDTLHSLNHTKIVTKWTLSWYTNTKTLVYRPDAFSCSIIAAFADFAGWGKTYKYANTTH